MEFHDEELAKKYLGHVSYFRMKYFWIDMIDEVTGDFKENVYFEDVIERYFPKNYPVGLKHYPF